jgi:hypothetical protein
LVKTGAKQNAAKTKTEASTNASGARWLSSRPLSKNVAIFKVKCSWKIIYIYLLKARRPAFLGFFLRYYYSVVKANEFFYRESLAAGSLDQLPAPLERIPADA